MPTKLSRTILTVIATAAVTAFAACGSTSSSPTPTSAPSATSTPTPVPVVSIALDPGADPVAFLNALPQTEVACASAAVGGQDKLVKLVGMAEGNTAGISSAQLSIMATCVSDETIVSVAVGQIELGTGGLSDTTKSCIASYAGSIEFASFFDTDNVDPESFVASLQAMFCLNESERAALETSSTSIVDLSQIGGIDALECAADKAGPTGLEDLAAYFADESDGGFEQIGKFVPIMVDCGVLTDEDFDGSGMTADQMACLFNSLDQDSLSSFFDISNDPDAVPDLSVLGQIMTTMASCGIDAEALLSSVGTGDETPDPTIDVTQVPTVSTETLLCLSAQGLSADLVTDYIAGQADPDDPALVAALAACASESPSGGIVIPDGAGGTTTLDPAMIDSLPFTVEQIQCLVNEIGVEQLEALANGAANPLTLLGALGACDIAISDLLGSTN